ncbi:MAG: DivIVA domain-containing protein [Peptococcaceae bacterium]|nr:MAG: DivIVA domain-containing protein [Peptococcaceae bacterium]
MLTPLDIQKKEFRRAFRGYNEEEVDSFLDRVVEDYENLLKENQKLQECLAESDNQMSRYRELEDVLKNTMIMAQKSAEDLRQNAEKEAQMALQEAQLQARQILQKAEQEASIMVQEADRRAGRMIDEAEDRVKEVLAEYRELLKQARVFRVRFRSFLDAQMKLLDGEEEATSIGTIVEAVEAIEGSEELEEGESLATPAEDDNF